MCVLRFYTLVIGEFSFSSCYSREIRFHFTRKENFLHKETRLFVLTFIRIGLKSKQISCLFTYYTEACKYSGTLP